MKKFITTLFVLAMFAFVSPAAQAQSGGLKYNEKKLEGLAMASYRQTCKTSGKVDVEVRPYRGGRHWTRILIRDNDGRVVGVSGLIAIRNLNQIKTPSDIVMRCRAVR